jgi:hypothetical protein
LRFLKIWLGYFSKRPCAVSWTYHEDKVCSVYCSLDVMASIGDWGEAFEVAFRAYSLDLQNAPDIFWETVKIENADIVTVRGEIKGNRTTTVT